MALRFLIRRFILAGRKALQRRRDITDSEFPENFDKIQETKKASGLSNHNTEPVRNHGKFYRVLEARENEENVRCGKFCVENTFNAGKFADDCTVSSYKFADDDTLNVSKLADEDTIGSARFAVGEIARAKKSNIEFVRVLKSSRTPSWSHNHQIILEVVNNDNGEKSTYYVEVESQQWIEEKPFKLTRWMSE